MIVGLVAIVMIFSIPLVAIVTSHSQKQTKMRQQMLSDELELERLKHQNYLLETEKMKLELEQMKLEAPKDKTHLI